MVLLAVHLAALIQQPVVQADVAGFRPMGQLNQLPLGQGDAVQDADGADIRDNYRRGGGQPANGQRTFNFPPEAHGQLILGMKEGRHRRACVVAPVRFPLGDGAHSGLDFAAEILAGDEDIPCG